MPPITPKPMAAWLEAPAPEASASGTTPRMKASEVMTMGRKRSRAACSAACARLCPCACRSLANSTIRMAFLAARPMMVIRPTLKYTSLDRPTAEVASTDPSAPMGTISITAAGMLQLSYRATSSRNTTTMASANSLGAWAPAAFSWKDRAVHS